MTYQNACQKTIDSGFLRARIRALSFSEKDMLASFRLDIRQNDSLPALSGCETALLASPLPAVRRPWLFDVLAPVEGNLQRLAARLRR